MILYTLGCRVVYINYHHGHIDYVKNNELRPHKRIQVKLLLFIGIVKKTFRYSNVFFYNPLCRTSVLRNIIMEGGIIGSIRWICFIR